MTADEFITMTAWDMCKLLYNNDEKKAEIGFLDLLPGDFTPEEVVRHGAFWYGIQINHIFGDINILLGMYAYGIQYKNEDVIDTIQDIFNALKEFWDSEIGGDLQPNELLYVDKEDVEKYK